MTARHRFLLIVLILMANKDYYSILGVSKNASDDEIKKAYKNGALKYHPDRQQGKTDEEKKKAEETFKEINEAYQVLSDKQKRRAYDTYGTVDGMGGMSAEDAMSAFMRHMSGMGGFSDFFNMGGPRVNRGQDIRINVHVTLSELLNGAKKEIKYHRNVKCGKCGGTGSSDGKMATCSYCNGTGMYTNLIRNGFTIIRNSTQCPHCHGTGSVFSKPCSECGGDGLKRVIDTISMQIPKGVSNNMYITMPGRGNEARGDGFSGDATLLFTVDCPKGFSISENDPYDINASLDVPVLDCITGGNVEMAHADGKRFRFKLGECVADGHIVRIKDKGLMRQDGSRGRLNVIVHHQMPNNLTNADIKALNKLKESKTFK